MSQETNPYIDQIKQRLVSEGKSEEEAIKQAYALYKSGKKKASSPFHFVNTFEVLESPIEDESTSRVPIFGVAIEAGMSRNYNYYSAKELRKAAAGLKGRPILVDHVNKAEGILGRVTTSSFKNKTEKLHYGAYLDPVSESDKVITEKIKRGLIDSVSIGASSKETVCTVCEAPIESCWIFTSMSCKHEIGKEYPDEEWKESPICGRSVRGIEWYELSVVGVPGVPGATVHNSFDAAFTEVYTEKRPSPDPSTFTTADGAEIPSDMIIALPVGEAGKMIGVNPPPSGVTTSDVRTGDDIKIDGSGAVGTDSDTLIGDDKQEDSNVNVPPETVVQDTTPRREHEMSENAPPVEPVVTGITREEVEKLVNDKAEAIAQEQLATITQRIQALETENKDLQAKLADAEAETGTPAVVSIREKVAGYIANAPGVRDTKSNRCFKATMDRLAHPEQQKAKFASGQLEYVDDQTLVIGFGGK